MGLNRGGRPSTKTGSKTNPVSRPITLGELGIDKRLADRSRKMAAIPEGEFEHRLAEWRKHTADGRGRVSANILSRIPKDDSARRADGRTYRLVLKSVPTTPGGIPETQRLKGLLKAALRSFGFRCVEVVETDAAGGATASARGGL